jgi:hypothetical protein
MATKMNNDTYKVIIVRYHPPKTIYAIPKDWDVKDIRIDYDEHEIVYYKGVEVELQSIEIDDGMELSTTIEETDVFAVEDHFDCDEEEE